MSKETLFIHILWASVSSAALYVTYKYVEKYTSIKSLEALALTSERIGTVVLQVLKESGGRFRSLPVPDVHGTRTRPHHHSTPAQTEENHHTHANPLFDLRN
uniref:Uncharacterized protein n=1 Tax=viral metagenome TaxID=1070528 RepID=A0A6C0J005_9ZZZZ